MIVTHEIKMDLARRGDVPIVEAVQDDKYSRNLALYLHSGGEDWIPPEGTRALVRFRKADGKGGEYDALPSGENALIIQGNLITAAVAPQVLTVAGIVHVELCLYSGEAELTCFQIIIHVQPNMKGLLTESEDYYNATRFVARSGWEPQKFLATDENGEVIAVEEPRLTDEDMGAALQAYLTENPIVGGVTEEQRQQIEQNRLDIAAIPVAVDDAGYTDIAGLRKATHISVVKDETGITVTTTLEGDWVSESVITLDANGNPAAIVTDGVECTVNWEGFDA